MIKKLEKTRKGQQHVEMVIAFTIFITFLAFLFVFFNPFKVKSNEALVNNIYLNMKEDLGVDVSSVSIRINDSAETTKPTRSNCFNINISDLGCKRTDIKVIVKDKEGNLCNATARNADGLVSINPSTNIPENNKFFTIYCSEEFEERPGSLTPVSCMTYGKDKNFTIGVIVERNIWSENKSKILTDTYNLSYISVKEKFLPEANDFAYTIFNETQGILFRAERKIPVGVAVDSSTTPIDLLDKNANIKKGVINILVW